VTGCAALLLQADPGLSPAQLEARLKTSLVWLVDSRNGQTYPRLDCSPSAVTAGGLPTTKDHCKKGGWQQYRDRDGKPLFKNQGDCVSFVATGGKNPPSQQAKPKNTRPERGQ
jgi:hypothetical protein